MVSIIMCILVLSECSFKVTPTEEVLTLFLSHPINGTLYETAQTLNPSRSPIIVDALIRTTELNQTVNSSLCIISSLEVYRGRQQAIAINESVFTLSDSGTIKVCCTCSHLENKVMVHMGFCN